MGDAVGLSHCALRGIAQCDTCLQVVEVHGKCLLSCCGHGDWGDTQCIGHMWVPISVRQFLSRGRARGTWGRCSACWLSSDPHKFTLPPDAGPGRAGRAQLMTSLNFLNILQSSIIFSGLVAGLVVCSKAGPPATVGEGEDTLCFPPPPALCDLLARVNVCIGARWRQECAGSRTELSPAACSIGFRASRVQSVSQAARRVTQTGAPQGVAEGRLTVGDAVLFITLMQQLYAPLNYFGSYCAARRLLVVDQNSTLGCFLSVRTTRAVACPAGRKHCFH